MKVKDMVVEKTSLDTNRVNVEDRLGGEYKKDNGIFYTNPEMARLIMRELSISKKHTIIDPCCGIGNFLSVAIEMGLDNVYGADKDSHAIELCKNVVDIGNVMKMDTLGNSADMLLKELNLINKPDFVIGNPPYAPLVKDVVIDTEDIAFFEKVKSFGNNLFIAALVRAFELVKEDGIISYIIPKNFLHVSSYSNFRKEILKHKTIVSIVDIGAYFKEVRGEQVVITFKNSEPQMDHRIAFKKYNGNEFIPTVQVPQHFYNDEIIIFYSHEDHIIYQKLSSTYKNLGYFCRGNIRRGHSKSYAAISGKELRKFGYKNKTLSQKGNKIFLQNIYSTESGIIGAFGGDYEASETITVITDGDENMCRYILGILHSRLCNFFLYKYCYNNSKLTMHTDAKYLTRLPFVANNGQDINRVVTIVKELESAEYLSEQWFHLIETLNSLVYLIYGLNEEEISYVDKEIRRIQSKRWMNGTN